MDSDLEAFSHYPTDGSFGALIHELIVVEIEPGRFRLEAVIAWHPGRCMLMGARGPRTWRSLDTVVRHLKTLGTGHTITRLELLT